MLQQLALKIERDLVMQKHFRLLLADVDATLVDRRREVRLLKTRIAKDAK